MFMVLSSWRWDCESSPPVHLMNIAQALGGRRPLDQASQPEPQSDLPNWQL